MNQHLTGVRVSMLTIQPSPYPIECWAWELRLLCHLGLFSCLTRIYPDYYLEIKRPMSLMKIQKKLKVSSLLFSHCLSLRPLLSVRFVVSQVFILSNCLSFICILFNCFFVDSLIIFLYLIICYSSVILIFCPFLVICFALLLIILYYN